MLSHSLVDFKEHSGQSIWPLEVVFGHQSLQEAGHHVNHAIVELTLQEEGVDVLRFHGNECIITMRWSVYREQIQNAKTFGYMDIWQQSFHLFIFGCVLACHNALTIMH